LIHTNLLKPEIISRLSFQEREKDAFYVRAIPEHDFRPAKPEEIIRQLCILSLINHYHYPEKRIILEYPVPMGSTTKRADIVILDDAGTPYLVIEVKNDRLDESTSGQLDSYLAITKAAYGVAVSRNDSYCIDNNGFIQVDIPLFKGKAIFDNSNKITYNQTTILPFKIDKYEKINQRSAVITIMGHAIKMSIKEMAKFINIRNRFLNDGIVIAGVSQKEWDAFFPKFSNNTPISNNYPIEEIRQNITSDLDILVTELLESSKNPLYGPEVVAFTELFNTLLQYPNKPVRKNEKHKLVRALGNLGFKKLDRVRLKEFNVNGENRHALWSKGHSLYEAEEIVQNRALQLSNAAKSESQTDSSIVENSSYNENINTSPDELQELPDTSHNLESKKTDPEH